MAPLSILSGDIPSRLSHFPRDDDNDSDDDGQEPNSGNKSFSGSNSDSNSNSFPGSQGGPCCFIEDNDPRANYSGAWTLNGTRFSTQHISTQHITTDPGSSVFLRFTGAGIAVFGIIPTSNDTFKPPTALYFVDGVLMPQTTLPFAATDIPNQPLFSTTSVLNVSEHTLVINITEAQTPYTIQRFFVPANGSTAKDMMIGQLPSQSNDTHTPDSSSATLTATGIASQATTTAAWQMSSSNKVVSLERTVRVLGGLLGTLIFIILVVFILFVTYKCRARRKAGNEQRGTKEGSRRETMFSGGWLTSTESILRHDSFFPSPPRSPRSPYSRRSEPRGGRSSSAGRMSMIDGSQAPALPPKPSILIMSP